LENDADVAPQTLKVVLPEVHPIEEYPPLRGVVQPGQELDQCCLPGAVLSYQRQPFAGRERKIESAHGPLLGTRIAESHSLEHEAPADRNRHRRRSRLQPDVRLDLEEAEQIVEVQALLEDLRERQQNPLDEIATLPERAGEKREHADGEQAG